MKKLIVSALISTTLFLGCGDPPQCLPNCPANCAVGYKCDHYTNNGKTCYYCGWEAPPGNSTAGLTTEVQDMCNEGTTEDQGRGSLQ